MRLSDIKDIFGDRPTLHYEKVYVDGGLMWHFIEEDSYYPDDHTASEHKAFLERDGTVCERIYKQ